MTKDKIHPIAKRDLEVLEELQSMYIDLVKQCKELGGGRVIGTNFLHTITDQQIKIILTKNKLLKE